MNEGSLPGTLTTVQELNGRWRWSVPPSVTGRAATLDAPFTTLDGNFRTHDGCNELCGEMEVVDGRLRVKHASTTLKFCGGGEPDLYGVLSRVVAAEREPSGWRLLGDDERELGHLRSE